MGAMPTLEEPFSTDAQPASHPEDETWRGAGRPR